MGARLNALTATKRPFDAMGDLYRNHRRFTWQIHASGETVERGRVWAKDVDEAQKDVVAAAFVDGVSRPFLVEISVTFEVVDKVEPLARELP